MYVQSNLDGLGKFKLKKLFKKLAKTMAPPHVRLKEMKKAKARKAQAAAAAAAPAAEATPAPQVEPTYYQTPLPQPVPELAPPQYYPRPMPAPAPYPVQYAEPQYAPYPVQRPEPVYAPEPSPSMYPSAMPERSDFPQWYPPDPGIEEAGADLPVIPAYESEDDMYDESNAMDGVFTDLFTGAATEAIARSKAKREQRKIDSQSRLYPATSYDTSVPYTGFNMMSLMPIALGLGAFLLLRKKR